MTLASSAKRGVGKEFLKVVLVGTESGENLLVKDLESVAIGDFLGGNASHDRNDRGGAIRNRWIGDAFGNGGKKIVLFRLFTGDCRSGGGGGEIGRLVGVRHVGESGLDRRNAGVGIFRREDAASDFDELREIIGGNGFRRGLGRASGQGGRAEKRHKRRRSNGGLD